MSCESKWESTQAVTNFTVIADSVRQGDLVIEVMNDLAIHATSNMDVSLMRTSALSVAILAAATVTANLSIADDFSALLADLSFGDAPSIDQPLSVAKTTAPEELKDVEGAKPLAQVKPVPEIGFSMPGMIESEDPKVAEPPQVALKDPIPATQPEASANVDFDAIFALQDIKAAQTDIPTQAVGHHQNHYDHNFGCDATFNCRPHVKPALPSSTFYQYFRSNPCYTNVWDGYRYRCGDHHKHLHGECDCFKDSKHGCDREGCGSCDGGCSH